MSSASIESILADHTAPIAQPVLEHPRPAAAEEPAAKRGAAVAEPPVIPLTEFDLETHATFGKNGDYGIRQTANGTNLVDVNRRGGGILRVSFGENIGRNFGVEKTQQFGVKLSVVLSEADGEAARRITKQLQGLTMKHDWVLGATDATVHMMVNPLSKSHFKDYVSKEAAKKKGIKQTLGTAAAGSYPETVSVYIDENAKIYDTAGNIIEHGPEHDDKNYLGINGAKFAAPPVFDIRWLYFKEGKVGLRVKLVAAVVDLNSMGGSFKDRQAKETAAIVASMTRGYSRAPTGALPTGDDDEAQPWN